MVVSMVENPAWVTRVPKGSLDLQIQLVVMVPSTTHANRPIAQATMGGRITETKKFLSRLFGGYTSVKGEGGYYSKKKGLIRENVVEVTSFAAKEVYHRRKPTFISWVQAKARAWGQESMGVIIENDLFQIPAR
jgi:hypothetical protein